MTSERLAVRIDAEQKKKLVEMAEREGGSISDVVRRLIDHAYDADRRAYLMRLIDEMASLNIEDVPDPDELSRQLAAKYDIEQLC
jgi:uncharacterized protein (DUF1778 family)